MSERRSSTICAVVKRPGRHCGDDLVLLFCLFQRRFCTSVRPGFDYNYYSRSYCFVEGQKCNALAELWWMNIPLNVRIAQMKFCLMTGSTNMTINWLWRFFNSITVFLFRFHLRSDSADYLFETQALVASTTHNSIRFYIVSGCSKTVSRRHPKPQMSSRSLSMAKIGGGVI